MIEAKAMASGVDVMVAGTGREIIQEYLGATRYVYKTMMQAKMPPEIAESMIRETVKKAIAIEQEEKQNV